MSNAMQMLNLTLVGRVITDPITKEFNGKEVTNFRIIYNQEVNGETKPIVFDCAAWNGLGKIAQYLSKGRLVGITSSEFSQEVWSKNGKTGINNRLIVNNIRILDKKPDNAQAPNEPGSTQVNNEPVDKPCPF